MIPTAGRATPPVGALWRLLHPLPSLLTVVAAGAFILLAAKGLPPLGRFAYLLGIEAAMQFAISAFNDYFDRKVDAGRADKPVARGVISPRVARAMGLLFGLVALVGALPLGAWFAALTAIGLGGGLLYDAGLKYTVLSWLPFSVAFPTLPLWAWAGVYPGLGFPPQLWWVAPVGAVLVLSIHLADTMPDLTTDAEAGVRGLAHRIGLRRSLALAWGSFAVAALLTLALWSILPYRTEWYITGLVLGAASVACGMIVYRQNPGRIKTMSLLLEMGAVALAVGWIAAITL